MSTDQDTLNRKVYTLLEQELPRTDIEAELIAQGYEPVYVKELVAATALNRNLKRRTLGMALILGGALMCLCSCVITLVSGQATSNLPWILYGLTTLGVLVVFAGLMKIF